MEKTKEKQETITRVIQCLLCGWTTSQEFFDVSTGYGRECPGCRGRADGEVLAWVEMKLLRKENIRREET